VAEPDLGDGRRGGRGNGAVRGEQEAAVDEEPTPTFPSSSSSAAAAGEGYGGYGGALCGEEAGLDPLQLGPAGAEAPPRAFAQDPHPPPLACPLLRLLLRRAAADHGRRRRAARVDSFRFRAEPERRGRESWPAGPHTANVTQCALMSFVNVLCDYDGDYYCCHLDPLISSWDRDTLHTMLM